MSNKYVESLLTKQQEFPKKEKNKVVLIQEINEENAHEKLAAENPIIVGKSESTTSSNDTSLYALKEEISEGPSMLELMMAAQKEAQHKIKSKVQRDDNESSTSSSSGFKKGFFVSKSSANNSNKNEEIVTVSVKKKSVDKKTPKSSVLQNVQHALKEEQIKAQEENERKYGPLSQFLSNNEWVTPDLLSALQANEVLSAGLKDPKCLQAIQLVMSLSANGQTNFPKEVVDPILTDPSVAVFMKEFSKFMAMHFEKLGDRSQNQSPPSSAVSQPVVTEIGPLHAQAIKNKKPTSAESPNFTQKIEKSSVTDVDDNKVQQILADPELRSLLMDADLQRVLMECGNPAKFREHMRDPVIANKISRLQRAGLVGTST